jgi:dihydroorotase-like cyclic amidohydrolase
MFASNEGQGISGCPLGRYQIRRYRNHRHRPLPFTQAEKDWGIVKKDGTPGNFTTIPNGCAGIENMYPYMLSEANKGRISFNKAVEICATNPAKLFGCDHLKGDLRPGLDADIVIYDPKKMSQSGTAKCTAILTIPSGKASA